MMEFGPALDLLKAGRVVRRFAWDVGTSIRLGPTLGIWPSDLRQFIQVNRFNSHFGIPWHASSPDLLAGDWEEVG